MRLIDADKLKEAINSSLNTGRETFSPEIIYESVDEQPTVFDVDEVVRQIKDIKDKEYVACTDQECRYCKYSSTCSFPSSTRTCEKIRTLHGFSPHLIF